MLKKQKETGDINVNILFNPIYLKYHFNTESV